jgi:hypothetical protein
VLLQSRPQSPPGARRWSVATMRTVPITLDHARRELGAQIAVAVGGIRQIVANVLASAGNADGYVMVGKNPVPVMM